MAGEAKRVYGTQWTLSSGSDAAINSGAVATPGGASNPYSSTQTGDYPHLALAITVAFGATPTQLGTIDVHIVPRNVDGSNHAKDITATYRPHWRGSFVVDNTASSTTYYVEVYDVPKEGKVMLYNAAGQQISANYTLKATPFTLGPA